VLNRGIRGVSDGVEARPVSVISLAYLRPVLEPRGFSGAVLIQAGDAVDVPGLGDLADRVRAGLVPPTTPEVVADRDPGGGYPTVRVAVALDPLDALLLSRGHAGAARDVADALEDAYEAFVDQLRRNRFEAV
jgi:hypothetical protein